MNVRFACCAVVVAAAVSACSSSGTAGHLDSSTSGANSSSSVGVAPSGSAASGGGAAVSGGSSSTGGGSSSGGGSGAAGFCAKLKDAQSKLASLSTSSTDPSALKSAVAEEISAFQSLRDGAPANVAPAIDDLVKVLTAAQSVFNDPSNADPSALQNLASKLPQDSETIASYVGTNCT